MVTPAEIIAFTEEVARVFEPDRIILFGSYAYGSPNEDSDVDILVVMPHRGPGHRQANRIRIAVDALFPMDLLVWSAREIERRIRGGDFFLEEVIERGLVLHAADDARVGAEGRKRLRRRLHVPALAKAHAV